MGVRVYIYKSDVGDVAPMLQYDVGVRRLAERLFQEEFKRASAKRVKLTDKEAGVEYAGVYRPPVNYDPDVPALRGLRDYSPISKPPEEEYHGYRLPEETTLEDIAKLVYGSAEKAALIRRANAPQWKKEPEWRDLGLKVLKGGQTIHCPDEVIQPVVVKEPAVGKDIPDSNAAPIPELSKFSNTPTWMDLQLSALKDDGNDEGLVVLIFPQRERYSGRRNYVKVRGVTSFESSASLFAGARSVRFSVPYEKRAYDKANLFSNHVVVGYNGTPVFCGLLVNPEMDTQKSSVLSWTAYSHTYIALKSHINPHLFGNQWSSVAPITAIATMAESCGVPLFVQRAEYDMLQRGYEDQDELTEMQSDIRGTTYFKFMEKFVSSIGRFLTATVEGFLQVEPVVISRSPEVLLTDSDNLLDDLPSAKGIISAKYNFDELAQTYTVMSQRRNSDDAQMLNVDGFPLPIFRNIVRDEAAPIFLEGVENFTGAKRPTSGVISSKIAQNEEDAYAEAVQKASGAAVLEASKAFARAVKLSIEVPSWTNPASGKPWELNTPVAVRSPKQAVEYTEAVISKVRLKHVKGRKSALLGLTPIGLFDAALPISIPFLWTGTTCASYTAINAEDLRKNAEVEGEEP